MVRHRKVGNSQHKHGNNNDTGSSMGSGENSNWFRLSSFWKTGIGFCCLAFAIYVSVLGYLETRVNTPLDEEKAVLETGLSVPERYWGTYRPGVYFGFKSREPRSPVFGLMWYEIGDTHKGIRHWCDQNDNLMSYGWLRHDGLSFGEQLIMDKPLNIVTSFIKTPGGENGGHWTARINVTSKHNTKTVLGLVWYGALDESLGPAAPHSRLWMENGAMLGHTPQLHNFRLNFLHEGKLYHTSYSEAIAPGLHVLKEKFYSLLKPSKERYGSIGQLPILQRDPKLNDQDVYANFVPVQMIVETPFYLDVVYTTEDLPTPPMKGVEYTNEMEMNRMRFDFEFDKKFKLEEKYAELDVIIARAAFSNMIGGIGYFYGAGRVKSPHTSEPVPYWRAPLYTAVPSRSFFPRGFLWDEGFHGLLIGRWSPEIQMDIAAHWLDLINVEGWIPREQILGVEAIARVPKEFIVQSNAAANPPMLLVQLAQLVRNNPQLFEPGQKLRGTLDRMFPRLQAWYQWFQTTQKGEEPTAYRWRGREDDGLQLNPKTLTSGLDDYPRASHPSDIERHVDLRCWMYAAADAMATIASHLHRDTTKFEATRDQLGDEELLNELHWSSSTQTYADYGLHTDGVRLVRQPAKSPNEQSRVVRSVSVPPQPKLVTSAFGYVSLFPMLLMVLKPESPKLGKILEDLDKPELLWSKYGLRSLSKSSPLYMKRNTEHDPPYWRGQVWLNINYLALRALKHYSQAGTYAKRAADLHNRLRDNVVRNVLAEYKRNGYLWEQYSGEDGKGSGCKPFTGWTALVVLIMAGEY
ncbi:mannosyl-oligosaccharide glucosidase [Papilio machaon]|uniref:mannosyl-oligosaccharide glucosidase n=1 Tax=Papilio machaon TaxID=76193 RepID=UPI001E6652A5|nr:mannosyl-oligosaccharide glucosidase [Papilio machaon]